MLAPPAPGHEQLPVDAPPASRDGLIGIATVGLSSAALLLTTVGPPEVRLGLALLSAAAVGTLASWLMLASLDPSERWDAVDVSALAACLAVALVVVITGILTALPGPVTTQSLAAGALVTIAALTIAAVKRGVRGRTISRRAVWHVALLVLAAGSLRFIDLGYSEYQGDEASVLHRAAAIVQDVNAALLAHRKGPGEILVATYFGQLVGRVTEADARFPFALASVMSVLAIYAVGRAMFGAGAGLVAALLWAINGYSVAFGRIVQYHSIAVLLATVALLCAWRAQAPSAEQRMLRLAALALLALCLVFAFNVITLGLPAALLIGTSIARNWREIGQRLNPERLQSAHVVLLASVLLAVTAAAVYVALEWRDMMRLLSFRLGQGQPFNNFNTFGSVSVRYLGLPYLVVLVGAGLWVAVWLVSRVSPSSRIGRLATFTLGALIVVWITLRGEPTWLAIVVWLALVLACLVSRASDRDVRVLGLAALIPVGLYGFVLFHSGTHWYEAFPAMVLIAGAVSGRRIHLSPARLKPVTIAGQAALLVGLAVYPVYAYLPIWPANALPAASIYRPPWRAPRDGDTFGFPHQDGLKATAFLTNIGALPIPYDSNVKTEVTTWYMPAAERCERGARSFFIGFSERRPSINLPPRDGWLILVRGEPRGLIRVADDTTRDFAVLAAEPPSSWFDTNLARLERPLEVPRALCGRGMPPLWRPN